MNYADLFNRMHPGFFEQDYIRNMEDAVTFSELVMRLDGENSVGSDLEQSGSAGSDTDAPSTICCMKSNNADSGIPELMNSSNRNINTDCSFSMDFDRKTDKIFEGDFERKIDRDFGREFEIILDTPPTTCRLGLYHGDMDILKNIVGTVDDKWPQYFCDEDKVLCAFIDNKPVSFCILEDMGSFRLGEENVRIGGPGCVGTVKQYRKHGLGTHIVKTASDILRCSGFGMSYIHFTSVPEWYKNMGYTEVLTWNRNGIIKDNSGKPR